MCAGAVSSWHHRRRACCCRSPVARRASAAAVTPPPASLCCCAAPESYCCSGRTPMMTSSCRSIRSSGPTCTPHPRCTCSKRCGLNAMVAGIKKTPKHCVHFGRIRSQPNNCCYVDQNVSKQICL